MTFVIGIELQWTFQDHKNDEGTYSEPPVIKSYFAFGLLLVGNAFGEGKNTFSQIM